MSHAVETVQFRAVRVHVLAGVATVTIDNPPLNVYDVDLIQDLRVLAATVHGDEAIRVVVLQSADPEFFVAHGDSNVVTTPDLMSRAAEGFETGALNYMQVLHEQWRAPPHRSRSRNSPGSRAAAASSSRWRWTCGSPRSARRGSRCRRQ